MSRHEPVFDSIERNLGSYVDDLIRICEVPAPPFKEERRAIFFASLFHELGLDSRKDEVGNILIPFCANGPPHIVLSAHLDTVFPFEEIRVSREESILRAPGISDDSAGLAALVYLSRIFKRLEMKVPGSLTILATVGEEGVGNLRGVKHFFSQHPTSVDAFISLDGCDAERLVTMGPGSKRVRIFLRGPGGHSWGDSGIENPIHASGELLSRINRLSLPKKPKTVINVGVIGGGTSVNAIPTEMYLDIDMRSESDESLQKLDQLLQRTLAEIPKRQPSLTTEIKVLGERPSGNISPEHALVRAAIAANQEFGIEAKLDAGSTDSNIPFSLGIPAVTLGVGGTAGKIHTPDEWLDLSGIEKGLKRTASLILNLLAGPSAV